MAKITYTNKEDRRVVDVPDINRVTAADMNEIKTSVNALYDLVDLAYIPVNISITSGDFSGSTYTNILLIGKTPQTDFNVFTNEGSGVLLLASDGYTFDDETGTLTMEAGNYIIQVWKKLT